MIDDDGTPGAGNDRVGGRMGALDGKVVVDTGAGQGIGREEALACARAGAAVVADDLAGAAGTAAAITGHGGRALALEHDVGDFEAAGRLVAAAVDTFGGLDGVVAKAGVAAFTVIGALELARYGVRVNAIAPGARTKMTEGAFGQLDFEGDFDPLDPANVAPVVVWLLSDAAAEVSGQVLGITGGLVELYEGWHVVASQELGRRWTPEELAAAAPELFGARPTRAPWRPSSLRRIIEAARGDAGPGSNA